MGGGPAARIQLAPFHTRFPLKDGQGYEWATSGDTAKDQPVKRDDHGMDAMRYAVEAIIHGQNKKPTWSYLRGV